MTPLRCYILDDEHAAISLLRKFISETESLELAGYSDDPVRGMEEILSGKPPCVTFLDVNMDQLSGLDVLRRIRQQTSVVLTTAHPRYAVSGFDLQATDFLLKPFHYDRFVQAIERVRTSATRLPELPKATSDEFFYIKTGTKGKLVRVLRAEISYASSAQNYVELFLEKNRHFTYLTLRELEEVLPASQFARVHKSYIINLHKVKVVEGGAVILDDGTLIPIGDNYRAKFLEHLSSRSVVSKRLSG